MAVIGGQHEQAVALVVDEVGGQPRRQEFLEFGGMAEARELEDLAREGDRILVELGTAG